MTLTLLLFVTYIAFIGLGLPDAILGSAWPSMYEGMGVPIGFAGIVTMITACSTIISSLYCDKLISKFGTQYVTVISVLITATALIGFSFSSEFYHLCILAVPLGLGAGAVDAALNNFVANRYKAIHMNWLHSFWGVGAMTGPLIMSYFLTKGYIFQDGFRAVAFIQFGIVLILLLSLPLWRKLSSSSNEKENNVKYKVISKKEILKLPGAKPALIAFFSYCSIEATTGFWASTYVVNVYGISAGEAARWASLFYIGITAGRFLSGLVSLKLSNRKLIFIGLFIIGCGIILTPMGENFGVIGLVLTGLGCAPIYPSLLHETPNNFGTEYSQSIMGFQMAVAYVGSTFMPPIFGMLASKIGYNIMPIFTGTVLILMITMLISMNKRVNRKHV